MLSVVSRVWASMPMPNSYYLKKTHQEPHMRPMLHYGGTTDHYKIVISESFLLFC